MNLQDKELVALLKQMANAIEDISKLNLYAIESISQLTKRLDDITSIKKDTSWN